MRYHNYSTIFDICQFIIQYEERKKIAAERYEDYEDKTNVFPMAYREYIKKIDNYNRYIGEIVKRTIF